MRMVRFDGQVRHRNARGKSGEMSAVNDVPQRSGFSEKDFYLNEFRGRTLAIAIPAKCIQQIGTLFYVVEELVKNGTRVIVISDNQQKISSVFKSALFSNEDNLLSKIWRRLNQVPYIGIVTPPETDFATVCRMLALTLGCFKLVCIDEEGGIRNADGGVISFVHWDELCDHLEKTSFPEHSERFALLNEIRIMLEAGVEAVNLCTLDGLSNELFTYAGSGTLFTHERYIEVRPLSIDDFDAANDLIQKGTDEGYLVARSAAEIDHVLEQGFGAFVEGRYLAGVGSLLVDDEEASGEIAALYTVTRFLGEGVGMHLVQYAIDWARELGLSYVFACTTSDPVGAFFERQGFRAVSHDSIVSAKWKDYDPQRLKVIRCYQHDLLDV